MFEVTMTVDDDQLATVIRRCRGLIVGQAEVMDLTGAAMPLPSRTPRVMPRKKAPTTRGSTGFSPNSPIVQKLKQAVLSKDTTVITTQELRKMMPYMGGSKGSTSSAIARLCDDGTLKRLRFGVYAVKPSMTTEVGVMAETA